MTTARCENWRIGQRDGSDSRKFSTDQVFKLAVAASSFEAGIQAKSSQPDCVIVDFSISQVEALQICENLRRNFGPRKLVLIALLPEHASSLSFDHAAIDETFKKPFDVGLLASRVRAFVGAAKELV